MKTKVFETGTKVEYIGEWGFYSQEETTVWGKVIGYDPKTQMYTIADDSTVYFAKAEELKRRT